MPELETQLRALGEELAWPATPDLAAAAGISSRTASAAASARRVGRRRRGARRRGAAATAAARSGVAGQASSSPSARSWVSSSGTGALQLQPQAPERPRQP